MTKIQIRNKDCEVLETIDKVTSIMVDISTVTEGSLILVYRCEGDTEATYRKLKPGEYVSTK